MIFYYVPLALCELVWFHSNICAHVSIYLQGSDPINRFNSDPFLWLSQAKIWISNIIFGGLYMLNGLRWDVIVLFVVIGGIVVHHCLNFFFHYLFSDYGLTSISTIDKTLGDIFIISNAGFIGTSSLSYLSPLTYR